MNLLGLDLLFATAGGEVATRCPLKTPIHQSPVHQPAQTTAAAFVPKSPHGLPTTAAAKLPPPQANPARNAARSECYWHPAARQ